MKVQTLLNAPQGSDKMAALLILEVLVTSLYFVVVQVEIDEFRNYVNLLKLLQIFTDSHNLQHIELKTSSFE